MLETGIRQFPAAGTPISADDFRALPETSVRVERINGRVHYPFGHPAETGEEMAAAPQLTHQIVAGRIYALILQAMPGGLALFAPVDVHFADGSTVQPDVMWVAPDSPCERTEKGLVGAPELVVEVLSPSTARVDKRDKFKLYELHGVKEYWIADPVARYLEVFAHVDGKFVLLGVFAPEDSFTSAALAQKIDVAQIFQLP